MPVQVTISPTSASLLVNATLQFTANTTVTWKVNGVTGGNSTGKITFGTEGGLFQQALGTPAVVCGPGNIAVAHKPDEHVSEAQMAQCDRMLERLVEKLSG